MAETGTETERREVLMLCLCPECPSWQECGERGGFCLSQIGKSSCITEENGCLCGGCKAHEKLGFTHFYYCIKGPEKVQGKKKK